jgi:hypothetical protein
MQRLFSVLQTYKVIFFTLGVVVVFGLYVYRVLGVLITADFETAEVEAQTRAAITTIFDQLP